MSVPQSDLDDLSHLDRRSIVEVIIRLQGERDALRAEVERLRKAMLDALECLQRDEPNDHSGYEDSGLCDPDCRACAWRKVMSMLDHALEEKP